MVLVTKNRAAKIDTKIPFLKELLEFYQPVDPVLRTPGHNPADFQYLAFSARGPPANVEVFVRPWLSYIDPAGVPNYAESYSHLTTQTTPDYELSIRPEAFDSLSESA